MVRKERAWSKRRLQRLVASSDGNGPGDRQTGASCQEDERSENHQNFKGERRERSSLSLEPRQVLFLLVPCHAVTAEINKACSELRAQSGRATGGQRWRGPWR